MSIMSELKAEVSRLARKEIKRELEPVKRVNAAQRKLIANLRRDITELQGEVARLRKASGVAPKPVEEDGEATRFWMSGKGVITLRKRLGLTQIEFAKLTGVTQQSVVRWEKTDGKIPFRGKSVQASLRRVRGLDKKAAWAEVGKKPKK